MFRREMGSKRGSLPPKEGDLTCMLVSMAKKAGKHESDFTTHVYLVLLCKMHVYFKTNPCKNVGVIKKKS